MLESSIGLRYFEDITALHDELSVMTKAGIENMDIDLSTDEIRKMMQEGTATEQAHKIRMILDEFGIHLYMGHAPYHPRVLGDEEKSREIVADIKRSIPIAGILGIRYLVVHPIFAEMADPLWGHDDILLQMNINLYRNLVELGKKYDVKICTENMFCFSPEKKATPCFCSRAIDLNRIMDAVPGLYVCLDNGHLWLIDEDMVNTVEEFGSRLKALHLHCNDKIRDIHVSPFEITGMPWTQFCKALHKVGYTGTINLESFNFFYAMPQEMLSAGFTYLNACCKYLAKQVN